MVAVNRIVNIPVAKIQPEITKNVIKNTTPIVTSLAVLAGSGMSDTSDIGGHINANPLPDGADVFNDPLLDQLTYRASQISDAAATYAETLAEVADGAAKAATVAGSAAVKGLVCLDDSVTSAYTKLLETISDMIN